MISEFEAYLGQILPQIKETYPVAKEREAFGQLRKLFTLSCQNLIPARRVAAKMLLFPPKLQLENIYWPLAPAVFRELFQTDLYWQRVGFMVEIPNPDLTQQNRTILTMEANGISLLFSKKFNPQDVDNYQVKIKMKKDSPLRVYPNALDRMKYLTDKVQELNCDPKAVLEFLEFSTRFALEAVRTTGFAKASPFLP